VLLNWADQELTIPVFLFVSSLFLFIVAKMRPYVSKYDQAFAEILLFSSCWVPLAAISGNQSLKVTAALVVASLEFLALVVFQYLEYANVAKDKINKSVFVPDESTLQITTELSEQDPFPFNNLSKNSMVQA